MSNCDYVRTMYGVPAEIGRRVIVGNRHGVIVADRGNYIGVNFDTDKPWVISNCHPIWKVEYKELGKIRKMTRSQRRYQRYIEYSECFDSFIDFCRWDATQDPGLA